MPKSKRNKILPTSRTTKKTSESKKELFSRVQSAAHAHSYIYVFSVSDMRNNLIKDLRTALTSVSDSRIMLGKTRIMALALGSSAETAAEPGTEGLSRYLKGEVGLLFSGLNEVEVRGVLEQQGGKADFARSGNRARWTVTFPRGEQLYTRYGVDGGEEDPIPMAQEPVLRKLGMPTKIVRGKVFLEEGVVGDGVDEGYVVCREGEILDSRQTTLLKIFGIKMAEFRVRLMAVWEKDKEAVRELDAPGDGFAQDEGGMDLEEA